MNKVISDFAAMLDARNAKYELHTDTDNVIRFRTRLPNHDATPQIFISFHEDSGEFMLILSRLFHFTGVGLDLFQLMNDYNADLQTYTCKMFIDQTGELMIRCTTFIEGVDILGQINEYISLAVTTADNYYDRITEIIEKNSQ